MNKYIEYAKTFDANVEVIGWIKVNLQNHISKHNENQTEIEHIIDYLISDDAPKRLKKMSYKEAKSNAEKWNKKLIKKGLKINETKDDIKIIKDFNDGFKIVKLVGKNAYEREGYLMRHCVSSCYGNSSIIYSLRDKDNMPHCTMEENQQIKGKGNGSINPKYIKYIVAFLEEIGMTVGDNEMKNLGYINVEKIKSDISNQLFNEKYIYEDEKILDLDGDDFNSLDLLDIKPIISFRESSFKFNFELPSFISGSFEFLRKSIRTDIPSGYYSKLASSGDYSQLASSGYNSKLEINGKNSIGANIGIQGKVKGIKGSWVVLVDWRYSNDRYEVENIYTCRVGKKILDTVIKPDVWYWFENGELMSSSE
jgi:hypothetical protein